MRNGGLRTWGVTENDGKREENMKIINFWAEKYFLQNLILRVWECQGRSLELSGRSGRLE